MKATERASAAPVARGSPLRHLRSRKFVLAIALVCVGAGLALNWGWLAAVGIAPILLILACLGMCALGLFMSKSPEE